MVGDFAARVASNLETSAMNAYTPEALLLRGDGDGQLADERAPLNALMAWQSDIGVVDEGDELEAEASRRECRAVSSCGDNGDGNKSNAAAHKLLACRMPMRW